LRFPYDRRELLPLWRALFFRPGVHRDDRARPPQWNRGVDLVEGLGHCGACHAPRNMLGASADVLSGAPMPCTSGASRRPLTVGSVDGLARWRDQDLVDLLTTGVSARGAAIGPMAEVVMRSTQHLDRADAMAIANYLGLRRPSR
jgi:mono/diheme cytochrome c family protein